MVSGLAITPNQRPHALRPQLAPILKRLKSGPERVVVSVRQDERWNMHVGSTPLQPGVEDGASAVAEFLKQYSEGGIDLSGIYGRLDNESLAEIPEVHKVLAARGLLN